MRTHRSPTILLAALLAAGFAVPAPGAASGGVSPTVHSGSGSAVAAPQPRATRWLPPIGYALNVTAPFRAPAHRYAAGHRGFDLVAAPSELVSAPAPGTVTFAGRVVDRDVVSVRVDDATVLSMEPVTSELSKGDTVARGELLGTVSRGGHCDGACVHLGVRVNNGYVNPMRFFRDKPVLLPWN